MDCHRERLAQAHPRPLTEARSLNRPATFDKRPHPKPPVSFTSTMDHASGNAWSGRASTSSATAANGTKLQTISK
jgi:hypothetical protein